MKSLMIWHMGWQKAHINYDLNFDYQYQFRVIPKINLYEGLAFKECNLMTEHSNQ